MPISAARYRELFGRGPQDDEEDERGLLKDTFVQIGGGVRDATNNMLNLTERAANWMEEKIPLGSIRWDDEEGFRRESGVYDLELPEVREAQTAAGGLTRGIAQFATGFIPGMQVARGLNVAKGAVWLASQLGASATVASVVGTYATAEVASQIADQIAFDPWGQRLSNMVEEVPLLRNFVTDYLSSDPDDTEAEARFKMGLEGAGMGLLIPGITKAVKGTSRAIRNSGFQARMQVAREAAETATTRRTMQELTEVSPEMFTRRANVDDFAGNIRLKKFGNTEELANAMKETQRIMATQMDEARRGVITGDQMHAVADDLGIPLRRLLDRRKGELFNAEEALAARGWLKTTGDLVWERAKVASLDGTDEAILEFHQALALHGAVQKQISGLTAEAGRLLFQFRLKPRTISQFQTMLEGVGGRENLRDLAGEMVERFDPSNRGAFNALAGKMTDTSFLQRAHEVWINFLLSGPQTHAVNITSNAATNLMSIPENFLAAGYGATKQLLTEGGLRSGGRVTFREAYARMTSVPQAISDAARFSLHTLLTNESQFDNMLTKIDSATRRRGLSAARGAVRGPIGSVVRVPSQLLQVEDEFFKAFAYRMELTQLATREGLESGKTGGALATFVREMVNNPRNGLIDEATKAAGYYTFTNPLGAWGKGFQRLRDLTPGGNIIVPFVRTPTNIVKFAGERTPLGLFSSSIREAIKKGGAEGDVAMGRMVMGSLLGAGAVLYAADGLISGGGPADRNARAALRDTGWQPYSIKINRDGKEEWVSYGRLEPLGMILGIAADTAEIWGELGKEEQQSMAARIGGSIAQNLTSKTFLRGISDVINVFSEPDRYGDSYIRRLLGTVVPTGLAQIARVQDPVMRDASTVVQTLRSRIPGYSTSLPARRNIWGEPIILQGGLGPDLISPFYSSTMKEDAVTSEFARLDVGVGMPSRKISVPWSEKQIDIPQEIYWDYVTESGQMAKQMLTQMVLNPAWDDGMDDDMKRQYFRNVISRSRTAARNKLKMQLFQQQLEEIQNRQ